MAMKADHARMCQLPLPSVQTPPQSPRSILRLVLLKMASTLAALFVCAACASPVAAFRGGAATTPSPATASIRTGPTASAPSASDAASRVPVHVRGAWAVGIVIGSYAACQGIYILSTHVMRNQLKASVAGTQSLPETPDPVFKSMLQEHAGLKMTSPVPRDRRTLTAVLLAEQAQKRALQRRAPQSQTTASHIARRGPSPGASRLAVVGALEKKRWNGAHSSTRGSHSVEHVDKKTLGRFWDRKEGR